MRRERKRRQKEGRVGGRKKEEREEGRKRKIRKQHCDQVWVKKDFVCLFKQGISSLMNY